MDLAPSKLANLKFTYGRRLFASEILNLKNIYFRCGGNVNLFLISAKRNPNIGASTVSTKALKPACSALLTKLLVTCLKYVKI